MRSYAFFLVVLLMASCAKLELGEVVECPVAKQTAQIRDLVECTDSGGWYVYGLYFYDKETRKVKAKIRKYVKDDHWYYYKCDSTGEYRVMKDVDPYDFLADYKLGDIASSFTFGRDSVRLYRCGNFLDDDLKCSLIIATIKDGYGRIDY